MGAWSSRLGVLHLGVVLKVLERTDHWEYTSLKGDPNQTGNPDYGHFEDRYFEQLPNLGFEP